MESSGKKELRRMVAAEEEGASAQWVRTQGVARVGSVQDAKVKEVEDVEAEAKE
jgi:hypothetical protein